MFPVSQINQNEQDMQGTFWHRWKNNELISEILLWTPTYGHTSVGQPPKTYIQQICVDTGFCLENQLRAIDDTDGWKERERERERERESRGFMLLARLHDDDDDDDDIKMDVFIYGATEKCKIKCIFLKAFYIFILLKWRKKS